MVRAALAELPLGGTPHILDAGCAAGATMDMLASFGKVSGIDVRDAAVAAARARGHDVQRARIEQLPFDDATFDLITCLDVVEHTPDDVRTFRELRRVTKPAGHLLVTVPAYQLLWSGHDVLDGHYRRYRRSSLRAAARAAGWDPIRETSFNALLLAPAAAVRLVRRVLPEREPKSDLSLTPTTLDPALELPLRIEAALIGRGVRLPLGLSLLAVLRARA